jgi:hypothetical protein
LPDALRHAGPYATEGDWLVPEDDSEMLVGVAYQFETERTWICWAVELHFEHDDDDDHDDPETRRVVTPATAQRIGEQVRELIDRHLRDEWEWDSV